MEKRSYVKPVLSGEEFVPQNYIAACGDTNRVYKFKCDAPAGQLYVPDHYKGASYNPCDIEHETPISGTYLDGWIDYNKNRTKDSGEDVKVYLEFETWDDVIWNGNVIIPGGSRLKNGHATTKVNMSEWETAKS